jgi:aerobic carbon-monoxide dehydrogenase medium subunit
LDSSLSIGYAAPASLAEALAFLAVHGADSVVLAGGMAVVPALKKGFMAHKFIVNIKGMGEPAARALVVASDRLAIGALIRHREIETAAVVAERLPALRTLEENLASVQIRNHGTLAGNLCAAEPWSDPPCLMAALDASIVLASQRGMCEVSAADWIVEPRRTLRQPEELLLRIEIPLPAEGEGVGHARLAARQGLAAPLACAAARVALAENGNVSAARVFVGAVGPRPQRMARIEAMLMGQTLTAELSADIDDAVARDVDHIPDERCGVAYKQQVAGVLVRRAIAGAIASAKTRQRGQ